MPKITSFLIGLLFTSFVLSQNSITSDLDSLSNILLKKNYLFQYISKKEFTQKIDVLKNTSFQSDSSFWELSKVLTQFKDPNIKLYKDKFDRFPFEIKRFKTGVFITKIDVNFEEFLGHKLISINNIPINKLLKKITKITTLNPDEFLNNKSLFRYFKMNNDSELILELVSKNKKETISIPIKEQINEDELIELIPDKTPFYKQKSNRWFWSYGINYGQQLYVKYNTCLSKEFFNKMKDSLQWTAKNAAKQHALGLQSVYDAPRIDDFHNNVLLKFNNRRYKKLFIDFRNNRKGDLWVTKKFINSIKNHRILKRKKRVYLLLDKSISSATMTTILEFQKHTNSVLVGEKVLGTINNTNDISTLYLPNLKYHITIPSKKLEKATLNPCIYVEQTFNNYKNGIDPVLQKALDN